MDSPFVVTVWDGGFGRAGWVGDPLGLSVTARHNAVSTGELTVASDHRRLPDLVAPGARVTIDYAGSRVLSGPVRSLRGAGPASSGTVTVGVESDWRLLHRILGWPVPGNALGSQNQAYDVRSGDAESVLKGFVTANAVTRLGLPVTVATNHSRGASIKVSTRFHPLADRLFPAVEEAGLGVSVVQDDATRKLVVDVYEPAVYPRTLTERSGVVQDWSWSTVAPGATRVIAGDQGEATARAFTTTIDSALETEWGDKIEVFRDARDTADATTLTQRRAETLADGAPKTGLKVTLSETSTFRYGTTVNVGDRVPLEVGPGVIITDVLREAALTWTPQDGLDVEPVIGERTDDPSTVTAKAISALARRQRELGAGR